MTSTNLKYHLFTIAAVILFSYVTASGVSTVVENSLSDQEGITSSSRARSPLRRGRAGMKPHRTFEQYEKNFFESGFFRVASVSVEGEAPQASTVDAEVSELNLIGTITGPRSIARAFIRKGTRKRFTRSKRLRRSRRSRAAVSTAPPEKEIFKLWEKVHGYRLISIRETYVVLKGPNGRSVLKIYEKKEKKSSSRRGSSRRSGNDNFKKNLSRSELKQKLKNNMDNAFRGLVAGPYRKNGKIVGFRLKKVRPYNIFYKMGARSGDIIKRVNGKKIDSTQKLYSFWSNFSKEYDKKRRK